VHGADRSSPPDGVFLSRYLSEYWMIGLTDEWLEGPVPVGHVAVQWYSMKRRLTAGGCTGTTTLAALVRLSRPVLESASFGPPT
jgi:hypothetical protein